MKAETRHIDCFEDMRREYQPEPDPKFRFGDLVDMSVRPEAGPRDRTDNGNLNHYLHYVMPEVSCRGPEMLIMISQ